MPLSGQNPSGGGQEDENSNKAEVGDQPVRVIFDTDVGGDIDDAGALAVLHALEDRGEIEILAIGIVTGHEAAVSYVHAVNTWYGKPELPVGTIKGKAPYARDEYMVPVVAAYPYKLSREEAPDVIKLYRKVLASQPDRSVTLITVGPATNIFNLLNSGPDEYSPLSGRELMRQKIRFYSAGGNGNRGLPEGKCGFNYYMDLPSASGELRLMPVDFPVVFAGGSGRQLKIGSALSKASDDHIIRKSYEAYYKGNPQDRYTWDQQRVLYACRPSSRGMWETSPKGAITLGQDSVLSWTPSLEKNHAYVYLTDQEALRSTLTELMLYDPRKK